jgi:thiol-disulfide isomerase/thioredoxin
MRRIEAEGQGGVNAALGVLVAGALTFRLRDLVEAWASLSVGGLPRLLSVPASEILVALPWVLGFTLVLLVFAGSRRRPGLDLELAAAAYVPLWMAAAPLRLWGIATGHAVPAGVTRAATVVGIALAGRALLAALRVARSRSAPAEQGDDDASPAKALRADAIPSFPASPPFARRLGTAATALLVVGIMGAAAGANALWAAQHASSFGPLAKGSQAPAFELPRIDGTPGSLSLEQYRGRVVLLDFWATWCPPCRQMLPTMHDIAATYAPKGVVVLGVNADGGSSISEDVVSFLKEHPPTYPVVFDDGRASSAFRVHVLPTFAVLDRQGRLVWQTSGLTTTSTFARVLDETLR